MTQCGPGRVAPAIAGFAGGALVAFFLGGPAVLADGGDAERLRTVVATAAAWGILAATIGWFARSPLAGLTVAAGALPIVVLLLVTEPGSWPVGAGLLLGVGGAVAAGVLAGGRAGRDRGRG